MVDATQVSIRRLGSVINRGKLTVLMVEFHDGSVGEIVIPSALNGALIEGIHRAFLPSGQKETVELDVLRVGFARDHKDQLMLKLDTAQAHSIVCIVPRKEVEPMQEKLADFERLPLVQWAAPN